MLEALGSLSSASPQKELKTNISQIVPSVISNSFKR
jgi:hypothetical protein